MAAKVVMVAVPTVLGIASIRVYTVTETAAEGLVSREKLNIYTPLPESSEPKFAPTSPGAIERGLTATREMLLPLAQSVKGACDSVKRGSINLYHAGEDVYYYLVDPPPGFLPRFGTITMAGLLGMFLARRGSRFKRLAVPLGLMGAGASVCYPAQAVAVLKVTGKKVYAVGQWSSAAASSLLTSETPASSPPQSVPKLNAESTPVEEASVPSFPTDTSPQSSAAPDTEGVISHKTTVTTKEESSTNLTEISPDATPETATGFSLSGETKASPPTEGLAEPVGSSESLNSVSPADDVSADTRPVEPTPSPEQETIEDTAAESVLAKSDGVTSATEAFAPVVESAEPLPAAEAESDEGQSVPSAEDAANLTLTPPPPPPPPPAAETTNEGSGFKPDAALMDFGQSSPEDEDLYSTRS